MEPGPAGVGRVSPDRAGQRVEAAPRLVRQERHGRPAGGGLRTGGSAQALRLPRPSAAAQRRVVLASDGALARPVQRELRCAALRFDQYVFRDQCLGRGGGRQAAPRLQPGQAAGLPAGGDRTGGHPGRSALGLRGAARQHGGLHDAADVPRQDRAAIRPCAACLGDGSRHPNRSGAGGNARQRPAGAVSGGNAERPPLAA